LLKKLNPELVLGILLASVFWAGVLFWQSSPPNHASEASQTCQGTKSECAKATTDERIADYTWWLAVLTAALVTVSAGQGYFVLRSDKTARLAATAADLSARAAIAIELPIIRADPVEFGFGISRDIMNDGPEIEIEYFSFECFDFANLGRTKAFPMKVRWGWTVGKSLPDIPTYRLSKSFETDAILEPGPNQRMQLSIRGYSMVIPPGATANLKSNDTTLWLYCSVTYLDFMQAEHEAGFCWQLPYFSSSRLFAVSTPAYNRKT
jgi:hypothetical protein